jgi:hypothetical protein
MALAIKLVPQLNHATIIEKRHIVTIACQGFSGLDIPESQFNSARIGGEQAKM